MQAAPHPTTTKILLWACCAAFLAAGLWLAVIRPMGSHLDQVPGELLDSRFNMVVLEHFYRWSSGLERSYWSAPFFYPYPNATAFSENLLGTVPFYALFRRAGLDRETAYQLWYILGLGLTFPAAAYVLSRLKLPALAVGAGAYFYTFGLRFMALETHTQMSFRAGIPLACWLVWEFFQKPRLRTLAALAVTFTWQVYAGIYGGVFLGMLLAVLAALLAIFASAGGRWGRLTAWPERIRQAWKQAGGREKLLAGLVLTGCAAGLALLAWPYYRVTAQYGFYRKWAEIAAMLPRPASYLLADGSWLYGGLSRLVQDPGLRGDHQLFPGLAVLALGAAGLALVKRLEQRLAVLLHLGVAVVLFLLTISYHNLSLYRLLADLPGLSGLRAIERVEVALMWPLALLAAAGAGALLQGGRRYARLAQGVAVAVIVLLLLEPILYTHRSFSKAEAQARLADVKARLPAVLPQEPILYLADDPRQAAGLPQVDAMLAAQDLGWPTVNGVSAYFPSLYHIEQSCAEMPGYLKDVMQRLGIQEEGYYQEFLRRLVPVGFAECKLY